MARLPRLMGRGRALEVLLGADDISGDLAELYGYVNRSLPDAELDAFVEALAVRIASFDKRAISETKRFVDVASLPPDFEIAPEWDVCLASIDRPAASRWRGAERRRSARQRSSRSPSAGSPSTPSRARRSAARSSAALTGQPAETRCVPPPLKTDRPGGGAKAWYRALDLSSAE
jgi:hypothetical protein